MVKVAIIGSRLDYWQKIDFAVGARNHINEYVWKRRMCEFASGSSPAGGVDEFVETFCKARMIKFTAFPPKVNTAKGFKDRNTQIAEWCDILVAFCAETMTGGSYDTIKKAVKAGKFVVVYVYDPVLKDWYKTIYNKESNPVK